MFQSEPGSFASVPKCAAQLAARKCRTGLIVFRHEFPFPGRSEMLGPDRTRTRSGSDVIGRGIGPDSGVMGELFLACVRNCRNVVRVEHDGPHGSTAWIFLERTGPGAAGAELRRDAHRTPDSGVGAPRRVASTPSGVEPVRARFYRHRGAQGAL